ncbi:MAG: hypothetical protein JWM39_478 [Parcubacteria group bacterium]|nr:hypothetical protein [Parcubacteria group bacterium]
MIRAIFISLLFSLSLAIAIPAATAFALTCNPACGSGMSCVTIGNSTATECISNATVDEITVEAPTATAPSGTTFKTFVYGTIVPLGNGVVSVLFAFALLFFIFGVFKYFFVQGADAKARTDGRSFILWGIIAMVVLFSMWGLVNLVTGILPSP